MKTTANQLSVICSRAFGMQIQLTCHGHYAHLTVGDHEKDYPAPNGVLGEQAESWVERIHTFLDANNLR